MSIHPNQPITEDWLKSIGFKWHQFDRQPNKQWLLWLGCATHESEQRGAWSSMTTFEDIGIELAPGAIDGRWFCWLRADTAHRYSRFLHVRHLRFQHEVIALIEAIAGVSFKRENVMYGGLSCDRHAEASRLMNERLDIKLTTGGHPWRDIEKDDSRGRALPEHMEEAEKARTEKP